MGRPIGVMQIENTDEIPDEEGKKSGYFESMI
jgi:hypothetical protein